MKKIFLIERMGKMNGVPCPMFYLLEAKDESEARSIAEKQKISRGDEQPPITSIRVATEDDIVYYHNLRTITNKYFEQLEENDR